MGRLRVSVCLPALLWALFRLATAGAGEPGFLDVWMEEAMAAQEVDNYISTLFAGHDQPNARYDVEIHLAFVETEHPSGVRTPVRVQLFVPLVGLDEYRGSYLFAPGSTGLVNPCRPSREHEIGIRWGLYRAHVLAFAGQGFLGMLPDYMGYEDWDLLQPYFHAVSEARLIMDTMAATDAWLVATDRGGLRNLTRVAAGFSQGGHAAFAAADRTSDFPDGLELDGVIGYGPTTSVEALFLEYTQVAPMVVEAYRLIYPAEWDPHAILQPRWAATLAEDTTSQCVGGIQAYYPGDPVALFQPSFLRSLRDGTLGATHPQIARVLAENRAGLSGHGIPALILQGTEDIVVDRTTQDEFVEELRRAGSDVRYVVYAGARHDTRQIGFFEVMEWVASLTRRGEG